MTDLREELAPWQRADKALLDQIVKACGFSHYDECDGVLALIAAARKEERERCARLLELVVATDSGEYEWLAEKASEAFNDAEDASKSMNEKLAAYVGVIAAAIRALGDK